MKLFIKISLVYWLLMIATSELIHAAASSRQDSLQQILKKGSDVETTIRTSLALADLIKGSSPDSCRYYLDQARSRFWRINALPYMGQYFEIRGDLARNALDFSSSDRLFRNAVFCYDKTGERQKQIRLLNIIGSSYAQSGNVSEAFRYYLRAREYASELGETEMQARIDNNLGRLYCTSENYLAGIEYYKQALAVFEKDKDPFKVGTVCMNLGNAYFHLLVMDTARIYANRARQLFNSISKKYYAGTAMQTIAFTLISDKRYPEALIYLDSVHAIAIQQGTGLELLESKFLLSDVTVFTGVTHCFMQNYSRAKRYLLQGYSLSDSLGMLERASDALQHLTIAYEKTGHTDSAFYYHKLFKTASDSLTKVRTINIVKLADVQMNYEKEVKEKKIQLAYNQAIQKRNLIIFIGAGAILLAVLLLLMLKLRIEKQKKIQAELEKQTADLQVEAQKKELTLNVMNLIRKNEMILDLSNRLIQIKESMADDKAGAEIVHLVNAMQKSADDNVWEEFELRFKQVHNNFYDRLIAKFPDLTPSELKLCALLKLNLSNKEISELSGQRAATLEMARYRLRKKLGISNSQVNLVTFLSQI